MVGRVADVGYVSWRGFRRIPARRRLDGHCVVRHPVRWKVGFPLSHVACADLLNAGFQGQIGSGVYGLEFFCYLWLFNLALHSSIIDSR